VIADGGPADYVGAGGSGHRTANLVRHEDLYSVPVYSFLARLLVMDRPTVLKLTIRVAISFGLQEQAPCAAAAVPQPRVTDPPTLRVGTDATHSVRQQTDDVLHIIQYGSKRREICDGVRRGGH
jgi:hypothetical protein